MNLGERTYSMKPETEKLLHQCRVMLLHYSNEQLNTLFMSWFERMVGEESIDEVLDDLCLLLGYGVRSAHSHILYATYTAWWEVEGSADLDGEFECLGVAACIGFLARQWCAGTFLQPDLAQRGANNSPGSTAPAHTQTAQGSAAQARE